MTFYASAQDTLAERNSLKAGMWAMQFGIASNFTLTSFQGSTIAFKYQLSEKNAIRAGLTINGRTSNGTTTTSGSVADTSIGSIPGNNSSDAATVSLIVQYLWYMNPNGPVHLYFGVGPTISYSYSQSSSSNFYLENGDYTDSVYHYFGYWEQSVYTSKSIQWGIGATGTAGVEWFACPWLLIRAEYNEGIQYVWRSNMSSNDYSYNYPSVFPSNYYRNANTHSDNSEQVKDGLLAAQESVLE